MPILKYLTLHFNMHLNRTRLVQVGLQSGKILSLSSLKIFNRQGTNLVKSTTKQALKFQRHN